MQIIVDADACPVTDIVIQETAAFHIAVTLVKNYNHFSMEAYPDHVKVTYVDDGADEADYRIVKLAHPGDVVVTQDFGLASLCLQKDCLVLHHKGFLYRKEKIDQMLQERHISAKMRKAGKRTKGPKKLTKEHKESFRSTLRKLLTNY
ncbi:MULTISPECIES: YaiI/YqxD family protein [Gracilibacillus]|uniref:YaiI/YqxD family protein n=1 Tax=Gracilibacillus TaxID=74385 RepID=UPI000826DBBB|nr:MULTISPECIES: YaiI/YqxD family protein [Gracilibacillus]